MLSMSLNREVSIMPYRSRGRYTSTCVSHGPQFTYPIVLTPISQPRPFFIPPPIASHPSPIHDSSVPYPLSIFPHFLSLPYLFPIPSLSLPHPFPIPSPSLPHPFPIPSPCLPRPFPVPSPSLPRPFPVPSPSLPRPFPVPSPSLPRPFPVPSPSLPRPFPVPSPSLPRPFPVLSPSLPRPFPIPSLSHPALRLPSITALFPWSLLTYCDMITIDCEVSHPLHYNSIIVDPLYNAT